MTPSALTVQWARTGASRLVLRSRSQHSTTPPSVVKTTVAMTRVTVPAASPPTTPTIAALAGPPPSEAAMCQRPNSPEDSKVPERTPYRRPSSANTRPRKASSSGRTVPRGITTRTAHSAARPISPSLREGLAHRRDQVGQGVGGSQERRRGRSPPEAHRPGRPGQPEIGRRQSLDPGDHEQARGQPQPNGDVSAEATIDGRRHRQRGKDETYGPILSAAHGTATSHASSPTALTCCYQSLRRGAPVP